MGSLGAVLGLAAALLLQPVSPAQVPRRSPDEGPTKVVAFQEVWVKSLCRPMEQLVDVEREYPRGVEHFYMPARVLLRRCSGCCADEMLECLPSLERNATLQLLRILPMKSLQYVELPFVEHQRCECRLRQKHEDNKSDGELGGDRPQSRKRKKAASGCSKCLFPQNKITPH